MASRSTARSWIAVVAATIATFAAPAFADDAAAPSDAIWQRVRQGLFQSRPIDVDASSIVELEAPYRAEDAATVPVAIRARIAQSPERYIDKIYLIIDHNPSPVAAIFRFTRDSGRADLETRVRVEEYTAVRAVVEMNDGRLYMTTRQVKASGGCSAPAGKDAAAAMANVGRMKFRVDGPTEVGKPALAQLMISHPNLSGLAMDQVTRLYAPPYFVRKVTVSFGDRVVMEADVDFSISENPNFRFWFVPDGRGELKAEVVDSRDLQFSDRVTIEPGRSTRS